MAQFSLDSDGNKIIHSKYTIRGVSTIADIFPNNRITSDMLRLKRKQHFRSVYNMRNKTMAVKRIFYDFLMLVLDELSTGGMLVFPGTTGAAIVLKPIDDKVVRNLGSTGRIKDIDIIKSRYTIPNFVFDFGPSNKRKDRLITIPASIKEKLYRNAENGMIKYTYYRKIL